MRRAVTNLGPKAVRQVTAGAPRKAASFTKSVAATILGEFFDVLQAEEGFEEVTPRLRKVVLEDGVFAEPSIRAALFPDAS
ncbi:hypothetical protein ACN9MC_21110 [Ensifer adhaerens]|uniref:hypothetical protein n=1 Tax=Ensifer adhaerens TaxID=106592 RepID=UPI003CED5EA4